MPIFRTKLDDEIDSMICFMSKMDKASKEYKEAVVVLSQLCEARSLKGTTGSISPDTALIAATNILGIFAVLFYEHGHTIVSKAFGMIKRV